jgi:hypothetical protein
MTATDLPRGWTWEGVLARLGEHVDLEKSARKHGAIVRRRVVKNAEQLLRLVLAYVLSGFSLRSTAAWADAAGEASFPTLPCSSGSGVVVPGWRIWRARLVYLPDLRRAAVIILAGVS